MTTNIVQDPMIDTMVKVALALLLGGLLGYERERRGRPAGLRTHILVCLASAVIMMVSIRVAAALAATPDAAAHGVSRVMAGVLTGIGFLGAGTIVSQRGGTRGLTTAASIWFIAILGMAVASGAWQLACGAAASAFLVLHTLHSVESLLPRDRYCSVNLRLPLLPDTVPLIQSHLEARGIGVRTMRVKQEDSSSDIEITLELKRTHRISLWELQTELRLLLGDDAQIEVDQ